MNTKGVALSHVLVALLLGTLGVKKSASEQYCYAEEENPYVYFASKTAYRFVHGNIHLEIKELNASGCRPRSFWMACRHGSRFPHALDIQFMKWNMPSVKKIKKAHRRKLGSLCKKDIELLSKWTGNELTLRKQMHILPAGRKDLREFGKRMEAAFLDLIEDSGQKKRFQVLSTYFNRTIQSAKEFLKGFCPLCSKNHLTVVRKHILLEFGDLCSKYIKKVIKGNHIRPYQEILKSPVITTLVERVSKRLGIQIKRRHIYVMYNVCRYYKAMNPNNVSAWCAPFRKEDLQVLEYIEDLKLYHDHGYAFPVTYEQACPAVYDLLRRFRAQIENRTALRGSLYFSHIETVLKIITRFGLFNDSEPLSGSHVVYNRLWRSSFCGGFASNLVFVLSKCTNGTWTVTSFVNEKRVQLPGCKPSISCPWEEFLRVFGKYGKCQFDKICEQKSKGSYLRGRMERGRDIMKNVLEL